MNENTELQNAEENNPNRRILIIALIGVVFLGTCSLLLLAFSWFQPDQTSLIAKYFPSPTPTHRPTNTPAPTRTPLPNRTATQQAWVKPSQSPSLGSAEEAKTAFEAGVFYLEFWSYIVPDMPAIQQPGDVYIFEIRLVEPEPLIWAYGWCTTTQKILEQNFEHIQLEFTLNGTVIPTENFAVIDDNRQDGSPCREYVALIQEWPEGQHQFESHITFTQDIDDGWDVYPAGTYTLKHIVTVEP